ncbi:MAG TPA: 23S rRNA (guanosine(2251)-2'-O)-methyltransferase RlmB [Nannocystaceae bacterium]|nr:23S rRNA (guanosine(2251)-2'-O)-methyltransferase RlmB [Nannocystaceae bacterium]
MSSPRAKSRPSREGERPRGAASAYLVPGERAVLELLGAAPSRIQRLLVQEGREAPAVEAAAAQAGVRVRRVSGDELATMLPASLARGMIAVADPPPMYSVEEIIEGAPEGPAVLVALDGVQDPHNLGAILRSAEFFGALGAIWPVDRAANLSAVVVRTSAGASERLPLARVTNLARALAACKDAGFWVIGTVVDGGRPLRELIDDGLPERVVVVLGSEETGLRRLTRESCDFLATIPRVGAIGSLNVSAAAAVTLSAVCMGTKER